MEIDAVYLAFALFQLNGGRIEVDQSALTGEDHPVTMRYGDSAKMGSKVVRGETEATVELTGKNTFFGKTASMLQTVNELGNLQKIILKIMILLFVISITLCSIAFIYLIVTEGTGTWRKSLGFVVVLLVASIPITIEIVTTCTLALASLKLAAWDVLVTRLVAIEDMAGMNMLCIDKISTLRLNKYVIQDNCPTFTPGETRDSLLEAAALAVKWKEPPRNTLDCMILEAANLGDLNKYEQLDYKPFDSAVCRTEGTIKGPDGRVFKTTMGAPHIILNLCTNKDKYKHEVEKVLHDLDLRGIRCMAVGRAWVKEGQPDEWELLGLLTFYTPRDDTEFDIKHAKEFGIEVKMFTDMGPDGQIPTDLAKYTTHVEGADGFAQVYPQHKHMIVDTLRRAGYRVGMTGDGVGDVPGLKRADVGIAVSGATDAARSAADILLDSPGWYKVVKVISIARCFFQRVKAFIIYRVAATLQLICFFFIALFAFPPDHFRKGAPSFFQMPVLMLMLITLLNDGTLIAISYDYVIPSQRPEKWNLAVLFTVASVLATVAFSSSLLLLWGALESGRHGSMFNTFGLPTIEMGQITTLIYLQVSLSNLLTLFSARTTGFFWTQRPSILLPIGASTALAISTILANVWPKGKVDEVEVKGLARGSYHLWSLWVWIYCILWWFVQDLAKVLTYKILYKFNIFNANDARSISAEEMKEGMTPAALAPEPEDPDIITVTYNVHTGKPLTIEVKGNLGKEVVANFDGFDDSETRQR